MQFINNEIATHYFITKVPPPPQPHHIPVPTQLNEQQNFYVLPPPLHPPPFLRCLVHSLPPLVWIIYIALLFHDQSPTREGERERKGAPPPTNQHDIYKESDVCLPSGPAPTVNGKLFSLRHVITGGGEPRAAQTSVSFRPSRTTMSVLVGKSRMSGGTVNERANE